MIRQLLTTLRRRLAAEDGIVILYALAAMVIVLALSGAALGAVSLDTSGTAVDTNQKQAYTAAQAGIQRYLFELNTNNTYWTQCVPSGTNWIVNTGASETGHQQVVPGSSTEGYTVMLLPASGQTTYTSCNASDPTDSMITAGSGVNAGTFRIASTGYAGNAQRTIVSAIRQQNFLDYDYFSTYETSDPLVQVDDAFASTNDQDTAIEPPDQCSATTSPPNGCGNLYSAALSGGTSNNGTTYPGATTQCSMYRDQGRETQPFFGNTYGVSLSYQAQIEADGPTTYWPLSDANHSTTAADLSGNGAVGTYSSSGVTYQTSSPAESSSGKGVTLAGGTSNYGTVTATNTQTAPTVYSEELWFKSTAPGGDLTTFTNAAANQDRLLYLTTNGDVAFGVYPNQVVTVQSPTAYDNGQWHFVVATQGSDGMHLYVDGQLVASNTTTTAQSDTGYWRLGGITNGWTSAASTAFSGSMSDAAFFPGELTAAQVQTEYDSSPAAGSSYVAPSNGTSFSASCTNIEFISADQLNGPFYSNDSVLMCGSPSFGQSGYDDSVEFGGDPKDYPSGSLEASGCSGSPTINGKLTPQDGGLNMPPPGSLSSVAATTYAGATCLVLGSKIQVAQPTSGQSCATSSLTYTTIPYPSNGVLYVNNSSSQQCNYAYDVDDPVYNVSSSNIGCGTVFVQGTDAMPLTIGSAEDIVIDGNLTYPSPNTNAALLGLIAADGFVRVYHPLANGAVCTSNGGTNATGYTPVTQIDAAILSLTDSFIVDNYSCGANLGTLTVDGAIAQEFRGTVGATNSQGVSSGYTKNYVYDRRLQYSEPPHFLAPTNGAYSIAYQTECDTGTSCEGTS